MFIKLFNWLVKRTPYTFALVFLPLAWGILLCIYGTSIILSKATVEEIGMTKEYIWSVGILLLFFVILSCIEFGFFRFFGIKWGEEKEIRTLNDNIIQGKLHPNLSTEDVFETLFVLRKINVKLAKKFLIYAGLIAVGSALVQWLTTGNLKSIFFISLGVGIVMFIGVIIILILTELLTFPVRRECKIILAGRGEPFKEFSFTTLKIKSKFFIVLMGLSLIIVISLIKPLKPIIIIFTISAILIGGASIDLVFESIYRAFIEIKESAKELTKRKRVLFFSGSLDKEIIDLSQNLNWTANEIYKTRSQLEKSKKALEEEKASLEIKVKARTKELQELNQSLEQKVKQRTKELEKSKEEIREKAKELEKWYNLTVGRELRMIELKQKIKELEKKQKEK